MPLVSVIMPAYNSERFIEAAIRSVIAQTVTDWELLVIDDGSNDSTCKIVERLAENDSRIVLIKNPENLGVAKTRNRGFDLCRGEYVALLDSDDVWYPNKLEEQLSIVSRDEADLSYCSYAIVDENGKKLKKDYKVPEKIDFDGLLKENVIGCSTVLFSRKILSKHRFETEYFHEDYVLWLDLLREGYLASGSSKTLVNWRYIKDSRSFNKRKSAGNRWRIYREHLGFPFFKSLKYFMFYAFASIKKYIR